MSTNGTTPEAFAWKFGFANQKGKWLTAEKFGYKLNASGTALKAKQVGVLYSTSMNGQFNTTWHHNHLVTFFPRFKL